MTANSDQPMNSTPGSTPDIALNTGAYVLNALEETERQEFEAHLAESETTRNEVTELSDTAVLLGMAVPPVQPPPAMKANLMALIASTPQLPREDAPVRPLSAVVSDPILPNEIAPDETALDAPETIAPPAPAIELNAKAQARWFTRPIVALTAVAAAVALIVGGGIVANVLGDTSFNQQQADQLAAINAAEDSQRAVAEVSTGGTATLVWSEELGKSALIAEGLEPLPSDKTYELWYINPDGTPTSAGLFSASADDAKSWRVLDGQMHAGDIVGVTIEPRGGSEAPTTTPIVAITSA